MIKDEDIVQPFIERYWVICLYVVYFSDLITSISLICSQNYSTITIKRLSKLERSKLTIENPLNEIIIGLLLGDGHIQKRSLLSNSRFM